MPASAVRQSVLIYSGTPDNALFLDPRYDLIERVLTFRPADALLEPRLLYTVELAAYDEASGFGFRAYDGAPLTEEGSAPLTFTFRTSDAAQGASAGERRIGCDEGLRGLAENCGSASCHGSGPRAAMGLMLDSVTALQRTAINRVAHQTEVGASAGVSLVDPPRFGVQMPVIEPGSAANSYLAYKLLRNPENFGGPEERCQSAYRVALPAGDCLAPSARERERMREWFVRLDPMPPVGGVVGSLEGLRLIVGFIDQGADVGGCE